MRLFFAFIIVILTSLSITSHAQSLLDPKEPKPPKTLQDIVNSGGQIFYLGEHEGMKGWALIRKGKPEFFYENRARTAMVMGMLFNDEGGMITMSQLTALNQRVGDDMYAATGGSISDIRNSQAPITDNIVTPSPAVQPSPQTPSTNFVAPNAELTPAQQMFSDIIGSNWVTMNEDGKHDVFAFIDPDCPHCKQMIREMQPYFESDTIRLRIIPAGIAQESERKAALLLATANPEERLLEYANGNKDVLKAPANINVVAAEANKKVLLKWGFDVTPIVVYRTTKGEIRIIRGRPTDYKKMMSDIINN